MWLFIGAVAGAALLIVAEFTTLYVQQIGNATTDVGTGSHDTYALVPIAMLTVFLGFAVLRGGSRPALLAIGITGVVALLIALLGDLPDTHANSLSFNGSVNVNASTSAGVGMYLETTGAVVLIATCGLGFLFIGPPQPPGRGPAQTPPAAAETPAGRRQSGS